MCASSGITGDPETKASQATSRRLLMGNEAIALGAILAGAGLIAGYPGTPSTEIIESALRFRRPGTHVEWSVNEKAALEVAAGAAYSGVRALVTMKQVGLNVASDPLMSLAYVGVKGGLVVVSADDPGPVSSQTEQDTRVFGMYSRLPVFDPSSPQEAFRMVMQAFELSERHSTPVILRPVTRVCHARQVIEVPDIGDEIQSSGNFDRDPNRWVIFPRLSYANHLAIEDRNEALSMEFSVSPEFGNLASGNDGSQSEDGVVASSVPYAYAREAMGQDMPLLKISTPYPFPDDAAAEFMKGKKRILVLEELSAYIENELARVAGLRHIDIEILGKRTRTTPRAGEFSPEIVRNSLAAFAGKDLAREQDTQSPPPFPLPARAPVLCPGCPHRASFVAVKRAASGLKATFAGDIGCYTLGNALPLDMVDTCLCMGADVTIAQGLKIADKDLASFAFIGDSTFFASGMTGVANAVYNGTDIILIVLDNGTTAMTGRQNHPGTGQRADGQPAPQLSIPAILAALGVNTVVEADPLDLDNAVDAVKGVLSGTGVRAVVFASPCVNGVASRKTCRVDSEACTGCSACIDELGCPALIRESGKTSCDASLCTGCGLCAKVCPFDAISTEEVPDEL